jgi:hypothetical protein
MDTLASSGTHDMRMTAAILLAWRITAAPAAAARAAAAILLAAP